MGFEQIFKDFVKRLKDTIAKLPPAEQFAANELLSWAIRDFGHMAQDADLLFPQLETAMAEAKSAGLADGKAEGLLAAQAEIKVFKETHIAKADHDSLVAAAAQEAARTAKEAARQEFDAQIAAQAERQKLAEETRLPLKTLSAVTDALLAPATAESTRAKLVERTKALTDLGANPADHAPLFHAVAEDFTPAGDAKFAERVEGFKAAVAIGAQAGKQVGATAEVKKPGLNPLIDQPAREEPAAPPAEEERILLA